VPDGVDSYAIKHAREVTVIEDHSDADQAGPLHCRGFLCEDGEQAEVVEWLEDGEGKIEWGPVVPTERFGPTMAILRRIVWSEFGSPQLTFDGYRFEERADDDTHPATGQFAALAERLSMFLSHDIPRAVLLEGRPGTGKSTGIRGVVKALGLGSVHVDLGAFVQKRYEEDTSTLSIAAVINTLRPDVLILDDLDRVGRDSSLLRLLEVAHRRCKLVLASVNDLGKLDPALRRPGRFDEVVSVDRLDDEVLRGMLGDDVHVKRMATWPAAYVAEWVTRRKVLGEEAALAEFDELEARIDAAGDKGDTKKEAPKPRLSEAV
jgi:SpoVK/Ycf46/Vps4 family AAA+-type ATPase